MAGEETRAGTPRVTGKVFKIHSCCCGSWEPEDQLGGAIVTGRAEGGFLQSEWAAKDRPTCP